MEIKTFNIKVPYSFYHLKDDIVLEITRASFKRKVSIDDLVKFIIKGSKISKRVANALANRTKPEDLTRLHRDLSSVSGTVCGVRYSKERMYLTITVK